MSMPGSLTAIPYLSDKLGSLFLRRSTPAWGACRFSQDDDLAFDCSNLLWQSLSEASQSAATEGAGEDS